MTAESRSAVGDRRGSDRRAVGWLFGLFGTSQSENPVRSVDGLAG